jgi:hypothetical protein
MQPTGQLRRLGPRLRGMAVSQSVSAMVHVRMGCAQVEMRIYFVISVPTRHISCEHTCIICET